jgi:PKD repeat protein
MDALIRALRARPRSPSRSRGQSLVELALVLPILLLLVAGALDLGRVFFASVTITNAAREGAMQAAKTPADTAAIQTRAQFEAQNSGVTIAPTDITASCSLTGCPRQAGSTVTVDVTGTFSLITPLLAPLFGGQSIPFSSSATAQVEYLPDVSLVTPPPGPVADFTISPNNIEFTAPSVTVTFTDTSSGGPGGWLWTFHDGTQVTTRNATFTYTQPGTYDVTLQVVNATSTTSRTKTVTLTAPPTPTPDPGATPTPTPAPTASPSCIYPVNVVGDTPGNASIRIGNQGLFPNLRPILTTGQKNRIQAQNPDHTQCVAPGSSITLDYRPDN